MPNRTEISRPVTGATRLDELIESDPGIVEVLEEFGIRLDPWTLIALKSSLAELAEYSAIRYPEELCAAVERRIERRPSG